MGDDFLIPARIDSNRLYKIILIFVYKQREVLKYRQINLLEKIYLGHEFC